MDINSDIEDAIKKNLPAAVGEALQSELAELKRLRSVEETLKELREAFGALKTHNSVLQTKVQRDEDYLVALRVLEERERNLKVVIAESRANNAETRVGDMKELIGMLFKGPLITKTLTGNLPAGVQQPSQYSSYGVGLTAPVTTTETTQG